MSLLTLTPGEQSIQKIVTIVRQLIRLVNSILVSAGHIIGTATNDSAAAGEVGEVISAAVTVASPVSLTTATAKTLTSITLTPGDWEVFANVHFGPAATTNVTNLQESISLTDNTMLSGSGGGPGFSGWQFAAFVPGAVELTLRSGAQQSVAASTIVYLVAQATFTVSTLTARGQIRARRAR